MPEVTRFLSIGAGFAGASTARALAALGEGPGLILEREPACGVHASGRNAGLLKLTEDDPIVRALAVRTARTLAHLTAAEPDLLRRTGGLTLGPAALGPALADVRDHLRRDGLACDALSTAHARTRFPFLERFAPQTSDTVLWCADEGVIDVHALLTHYLRAAKAGGFVLRTDCGVEGLVIEAGRVVGVETPAGIIRADAVVDATGAWAGRLGRAGRPLPLEPVRRHLFVSGPVAGATRALPFIWVDGADFYLRGEGDGLLLSPCDATPAAPGLPSTDPAAAELLADKLARYAPGLGDFSIRRAWACLRTFAPDRRPLIGADPGLPGLFHVSGLGGFGVMTSAAVGELAASVLVGRVPDWFEAAAVHPARTQPGAFSSRV
jgi:D-arginine dehydrogenase